MSAGGPYNQSALGVYLRGLAMGAADIVPGVSGGTIALITGIYDRLLGALTRFDTDALTLLLRGQWQLLWRAVDGRFLLPLLGGIGSAVLLLAQFIQVAMTHYPLPLWSFFFGLVACSAVVLWFEEVTQASRLTLLMLVVGIGVAAAIGLTATLAFPGGMLGFFFAGALAICAMILPGISGSFVLLLLGMYGPVIEALTRFNWPFLATFTLGCAVGLLLFSRLLKWVLAVARQATMALLAGFLAGSLVTLWPWQRAVSTVIDRHGDSRVVQTQPLLPADYALQYGDSQLLMCLVSALVGVLVIGVSHRRWVAAEARVR